MVAVAEQEPYKSISMTEFEANHGKTITLEGLAVNAKPHSYLFTGYHVYIHSEDLFFWPKYIQGQVVKVTGRPIVVADDELEYAQITDVRKRYFFIVDSWTLKDQ